MLNFTHADFSRIKKCSCQGLYVFENKSFIQHYLLCFYLFLTINIFATEQWRAHLFFVDIKQCQKILLFHFRNIKISLNMFTFKKNQPNFVSSNLKFHNQYCHNLPALNLRTWNSTTNIACSARGAWGEGAITWVVIQPELKRNIEKDMMHTPLQNVWSGSKSVITFGWIKILAHPC